MTRTQKYVECAGTVSTGKYHRAASALWQVCGDGLGDEQRRSGPRLYR
jgi:hypothetical protein